MLRMLNFILGIGFMVFLLPIVESIVETITLFLERFKASWSLEIAKTNSEIRKYNSDSPLDEAGGFKILGFTSGQEVEEGEDIE